MNGPDFDKLKTELARDMDAMEQDGLCRCGKVSWKLCDCGVFFLRWICEYDSTTGQCGLAGTEDCDWKCPRGGF